MVNRFQNGDAGTEQNSKCLGKFVHDGVAQQHSHHGEFQFNGVKNIPASIGEGNHPEEYQSDKGDQRYNQEVLADQLTDPHQNPSRSGKFGPEFVINFGEHRNDKNQHDGDNQYHEKDNDRGVGQS